MTLDIIASVVCGFIAFCLFGLHIMSSPKWGRWMVLPPYVRWGIVVTGALFMVRSVNFTQIAPDPAALGHINAEGLLSLMAIAYTIGAISFWVGARHLPPEVWARLHYAEKVQKENSDLVPAMVTKAEVASIARPRGITAVPPAGSPESFLDALSATRPPTGPTKLVE